MAETGQAPSSVPTNMIPFAPDYPKTWGSESHTLRFSQRIDCISSSPISHKFLAVACGNTIQIYNLRSLQLVETLQGHDENVHVVSFFNENLLVSSSGVRLGTVIIWRLDDEGKNIHKSQKLRMDIHGLAEAAADAVLDRLRAEGNVGTGWNQQDRTNLTTAFTPAVASFQNQTLRNRELTLEGKLLGFGSDPWYRPSILPSDPETNLSALLVSSAADCKGFVNVSKLVSTSSEGGEKVPKPSGSVKIYPLALQEQATDSVVWAGFSPNKKMLAIVSWDQYARIYAIPPLHSELPDGTPLELLYKIGPTGGQNWAGAWHPSSEYFAFSQGSPQTVVYVYRIFSLDQIEGKTPPPERIHEQRAFSGWCRSIAWSPDGKMLLCAARNKALLYNPFTGTIIHDFSSAQETKSADTGGSGIKSRPKAQLHEWGNAQWTNENRSLWTTGDAAVEMYDRDKNLMYRWEPNEEDKWNMGYWSSQVVLAEGRLIIANGDNTVRIWDVPE
jgi:WD40 repeat protein